MSIVGTRVTRTPGSAHVIGQKQLARLRYDDPLAVVAQVPGVYVRQEDGMGLRPNIGVRGANPDRSKKLTLMEDGILFGPAPYSAPAAYFFPVMARMTTVRVVKGPGSLVYGPQTVGGAVDLVTRQIPATTSGAIDVGAGEYGYLKSHGYVGTSDGQIGFLVEGIHIENTGWKELPTGADTGFARNEWMFKGSYLLDPSAEETNELRLKLTYSDEVSNETYLGLTDADFRKNPYQRYPTSALDRMVNHRTSIVATHVFESEADLKLTTSAYRHDYARVWRKVNHFAGAAPFDVLTDPDSTRNAHFVEMLRGDDESNAPGDTLFIGPNDRTYVSQGIQSVTEWKPVTGPLSHRVELGVRLHHDSITRRHEEEGFLVLGGELFPSGARPEVTTFNEDTSTALALHAVDAVTWKALTVMPGVRLEIVRATSQDRLSGRERSHLVHALLPGAGAHYAITEELGVLAGAYRGFSPSPPPTPPPETEEDRHEAKLEPEYSVNYEAGARFTSGRARLEAIGFYNDYSNLTDLCTLSSGCADEDLDRQFDAGKAHIYGLEAFAQHDLPLGAGLSLPAMASYTLTFAEFQNTFESDDPIYGSVVDGDEMPYVPRHQLSTTLGVEHGLAGVNTSVSYVSPMREQAGDEPVDQVLHTDEQLWADVTAYGKPWEALTVYVNVRNVTGSQSIVSHRPYGARPNAPRWVQVGAKLEF